MKNVGAKGEKTLVLCGFSWYYTYAGKLDDGQVHRAINGSFAKFPAETNSKINLAMNYTRYSCGC